MKKELLCIAALALATLTACVAGLRTADSSTEAEMIEIRAIEKARLQALVDGRIDVAKQYHADDFQLINPVGMTFSRDKYFQSIASGQLKYFTFEPVSPIEVRLYGSAAVLRYRSNMKIAWKGKMYNPSRCWHTDLYEKRDGHWQIVWSQEMTYWYGKSENAIPPNEPPEPTPAARAPVAPPPAGVAHPKR